MSMEQPQRGAYQDDEISLVDLAKILVRRRWWLLGTAGVIFLLSLAFALLTRGDDVHQYTSVYQLVETEPGEPITSAQSVIQEVQSLYWPRYRREYREENNVSELPFELTIENPTDSTLITLRSNANEETTEQVIQLHQTMLDQVIENQQAKLDRRKAQLDESIERTAEMLERVENSESDAAVELASSYADSMIELENERDNLTEGEVLETAAQGERQYGTLSGKLILVLGFVLAGMSGIIMAFFAEFAFRVRESLAAEKEAYK